MPKVLLLNPIFQHGSSGIPLQGMSGKTYGNSRYYPEHGCNGVEMTLPEYNAAWRDIWNAIHLPARGWLPKFVEDAPTAAAPSPHETSPEEVAEEITKGGAPPVADAESGATSDAHGSMPFFTLKKIAKDEGVDLATFKTNHERAAAINAARQQRKAVPA